MPHPCTSQIVLTSADGSYSVLQEQQRYRGRTLTTAADRTSNVFLRGRSVKGDKVAARNRFQSFGSSYDLARGFARFG